MRVQAWGKFRCKALESDPSQGGRQKPGYLWRRVSQDPGKVQGCVRFSGLSFTVFCFPTYLLVLARPPALTTHDTETDAGAESTLKPSLRKD